MDNQMLAYYLMNQRAAQNRSPLSMFAQNFTAGMGSDGGDMWGTIGDFLNGRSRKAKGDKLSGGEAKSWAASGDALDMTDSLWGPYSP